MANATTRVQVSTTPWTDDKIKRRPVSTAQVYYPGAMIAVDGSGLGTKCDDTAGLTFDGINALTVRLQVFSDDDTTDPARQIMVERPFRFQMYIASASLSDIGKAVYAKYDNEVAFSTSNSILVGWVDDVISSTFISIRPAYAGVRGNAEFDGATLTFTGSTGGNTLVIPDNLADALSVVEGSNKYLTFVTTNSGEAINVLKTLAFAGTTGNNVVGLTDNLADALSVKEGSNAYLTFVTTNGSEAIQVKKALSFTGTTGGIGYGAGAGGAVTQSSSRTTGVTLNTLSGAITLVSAAGSATAASFTVTNSAVAATDTVVVSQKSGTDLYELFVTNVAAGSFKITFFTTGGTTTEQPVFNFAILKGAAS